MPLKFEENTIKDFDIKKTFGICYYLSAQSIYENDSEGNRTEMVIGSTLVYLNAATLIQNSLTAMSQNIYDVYNSNQYMLLFKEFMSYSESFEKQVPDEISISSVTDIEFKNVSYSYDNEVKHLDNVTVDFKAGKVVAVLGRNGSGKSTLTKLLCNLYNVQKD